MKTKKSQLTYRDSGVDIDAGDRLVQMIAPFVRSTRRKEVRSAKGGYASLFRLGKGQLIAASTDGVGTKLKLAFELGIHHTVGIDLVAMSVNDLLCVGAEPLFFLDYFATGRLKPKVAARVIEGIAQGCRQTRCALVGGETAEMPSFYAPGEYDLAGFAVGQVQEKALLPRRLKKGDLLIGLASSGFHSNGYSLLRKLVNVRKEKSLAKKLLTPTEIYTPSLLPQIQKGKIKALSHITGSGFLNVPRMEERMSYSICLPQDRELPAFVPEFLARSGLSLAEQVKTWNCGVGMVAAVAPEDAKTVVKQLAQRKQKAWILGTVLSPRGKLKAGAVEVSRGEQSCIIQ